MGIAIDNPLTCWADIFIETGHAASRPESSSIVDFNPVTHPHAEPHPGPDRDLDTNRTTQPQQPNPNLTRTLKTTRALDQDQL